MVLAAKHPAAVGQAFIVADGDPITFRDYFDALASIASRPPVRRSLPVGLALVLAALCELRARIARSATRPLLTRTAVRGVTAHSRMSCVKIRDLLGLQPRHAFASAIDELKAWYVSGRTTTIA
jgi:nucleoside-diphosphate-sugar epimerase